MNKGDDGFVDMDESPEPTQIEEVLRRLQALRTDGHIQINEVTYAVDLGKDFSIDENGLSEEFSTQGARFAYYAAMTAKAKAARDFAKMVLEEKEAKVANRIRSLAEKISIPAVNAEVVVDEGVQQAKRDLIKAEQTFEMVKGFMQASRIKSEMLMQMGAHVRAELGNIDFTMRETAQQAMKTSVENIKK